MPSLNEKGPPDHRPLIYLVAAVLILGAAAVLFWPRGQNPQMPPSMVLTPESVRQPEAAQTAGDETAETALQAGVETPALPGDALAGGERRIVDGSQAAASQETLTPPESATETAPARPATRRDTASTPTSASQPTAVESNGPGSAGRFVLNVGSFSSRENADRLVERLARQAIQAHVHRTTTETGQTVYRVRVGYFEERGDAERYGAYLGRTHDLKSWVGPR